ncbi:MAG TPA: adenosylmethionine decarboxylase [Symbiobacteriaceae bacterium]|jgi:S-adenosylmethionine decarboxylase|nr:adenosylmethionine decarboxylase [Symbiobacteriaceae bacterium]
MAFSTYGRHVAMDLREVSFDKLNDADFLKSAMVEAANRCGATIVGENFIKFHPQGVTGVLVLSESHLSIHTYPEEGFAAIDCYTCGTTVDPEVACDYLMDVLGGRVAGYRALQRGTGEIVDMPKLRLAAVR